MTYSFYFCMCLGLIIIQTAIIPNIPILDSFYDIFIPFVISLSLSRPVRESIFCILIVGMIMDSLSGSPFMLYVTGYFWVYVIIQWLAKIIQIGTRFRIPFLVSLGVLIKNLIFIFILTVTNPGSQQFIPIVQTVFIQIVWAFCTGAFIMVFFEYSHRTWNRMIQRIFIKQGRGAGS